MGTGRGGVVKISVWKEICKRASSQILIEVIDTIQRYFNTFLQNKLPPYALFTTSQQGSYFYLVQEVTVPKTCRFLRKQAGLWVNVGFIFFHERKNKTLRFNTFVRQSRCWDGKPSTSLLKVFANPPSNKIRLSWPENYLFLHLILFGSKEVYRWDRGKGLISLIILLKAERLL